VRLAAILLTAAGLVVLFEGMAKAAPLVFFGTAEERAGLADGRRLMLLATLVLAVAAALLMLGGARWRAALVVSPGVVATALVYAFPKASYAWPAFVVLAPAAMLAAATAPPGRSP
jgi:hypothetical protein